jgi:hypothetical protein
MHPFLLIVRGAMRKNYQRMPPWQIGVHLQNIQAIRERSWRGHPHLLFDISDQGWRLRRCGPRVWILGLGPARFLQSCVLRFGIQNRSQSQHHC